MPHFSVMERPELPWAQSILKGKPRKPAKPTGPLIYVYEIPQYLNSWQYHHTIALDWFEPMIFLERLLSSPQRTADPKLADFFYIPLILRCVGFDNFKKPDGLRKVWLLIV